IERARTDARHGRLNLPKRRKVVLGFAQAGQDYLAKLEEEDGKDIVKKRYRLKEHLVPFFGDKPLAKVETFHVDGYKKARLEAGAAAGSVNRELATLSHLFTKSVEWKWVDHKPAVIKRLKEDKGRIVYLMTDQASRLLEAAKHDQCWKVYPFIVIGLETAMRRMEILSIRLEYIDLQKQVIYVPQAKAGAREQPITEHLAEFLKGYVEAAEPGQVWLFPASSASGHTVSIEKAFRRVVAAAGLDPKEVVRHTLRHTAITHLVQSGVDLPTVQRISGHKTMQMVVRYSHQSGEHIRAAMTKLERRYRPLTVVKEET
ncbi:MAG: tyrosine-type recombinase/integrase, partial [Gammaproteobacteria bacterium]